MIVLFYSCRAFLSTPEERINHFLGGPGVGIDVDARLPCLLEHEALEHREDETAEGIWIDALRELSSPLGLLQRAPNCLTLRCAARGRGAQCFVVKGLGP